MSPGQKKVVGGLGCITVLAFGLLLLTLALELFGVSLGDHATITEIFRLLWANQPWVVFIVSHTIAAPFWFLAGHFFGAGKEEYAKLREEP